jgi:acetyl esterase/lipase
VPLDPIATKILKMTAAAGSADVSRLSVSQLRDGFHHLARMIDIKNAPIGKVEDRMLPGPAGPLRARIYTPQEASPADMPGLVYFHGGGGIFGSIDTHDGLCRMLSNDSGCITISVDYRQAPEHKFPAALEDSYAATQWVIDQARELGVDPYRLAVGGDSAGGGIAAAICQIARLGHGPRPALQVLLCPVMDMKGNTNSRHAFSEGYFLNKTIIDWMLNNYCGPDADLDDPRLSPLRATDLSDLPPAHIHTAEFDPLRDEGQLYADLLRQSGIPVRYTCHEGMIHHFYGMAGVIPYARTAMSAAGAAIKSALA